MRLLSYFLPQYRMEQHEMESRVFAASVKSGKFPRDSVCSWQSRWI